MFKICLLLTVSTTLYKGILIQNCFLYFSLFDLIHVNTKPYKRHYNT